MWLSVVDSTGDSFPYGSFAGFQTYLLLLEPLVRPIQDQFGLCVYLIFLYFYWFFISIIFVIIIWIRRPLNRVEPRFKPGRSDS